MQESNNNQIIEISEQPIPLCQLLKIANLVSGGGEAKIVISEGYVLLNNEVEYQKRKKVYEGDTVEFNGDVIQVAVNPNSKPAPMIKIVVEKPSNTVKSNKNSVSKTKNSTGDSTERPLRPRSTSGRRSISF
jgi:ribosome-associated protein|tara:strand:+ start:135 stop:530 length:396 start_codon:yes stop_codon:yes gene_type:complete